MNPDPASTLLEGPISVLHLGISGVAEGIAATGGRLSKLEFRPPAGGDPVRMRQLDSLLRGPAGVGIDAANQEALSRFLAAEPMLVGVGVARDVIPGMAEGLFLHAGPPIAWERMSGPLRGAVIGGLLLEGCASTPAEAMEAAASGTIRFEPCHAHGAVGPMAGLVTPSMPVWIVQDRASGIRSYCTLNEGLGKVLRYGAFTPEVLDRLRFMGAILGPALAEALAIKGPIDLRMLMAQSLQMGDEGHNRNRAGTSLLIRELAPSLLRTGRPADHVIRVLEFINSNDHFFLNLSMPMAKCMLRAAEGVANSTMLTVMARNGTDFGIQVASMPGRWFTGPAQHVQGLYFPGFEADHANPDIGDSAITETAGIGAFAMAAAPAIVRFIGGNVADATATSRRMGRITVGRNPTWALPGLDFQGTPTGIDVRRVEELDLLPTINTGIAHKEPGVGQVGAGLVHPPWECFHGALEALAAEIPPIWEQIPQAGCGPLRLL